MNSIGIAVRIIVPLLLLVSSAAYGAPAQEKDLTRLLQEGETDIRKWNISGASGKADTAIGLAETDEEKHDAYYLKAVTEYYRGNYGAAREYAEKTLKAVRSGEKDEGDGFMEFIQNSALKKPEFDEVKSEHFTIRYANPKDYIIAEYGKDVLESPVSRSASTWKISRGPGRGDIPDLESFTTASTLPPRTWRRRASSAYANSTGL
jgi:hypothetical protein